MENSELAISLAKVGRPAYKQRYIIARNAAIIAITAFLMVIGMLMRATHANHALRAELSDIKIIRIMPNGADR